MCVDDNKDGLSNEGGAVVVVMLQILTDYLHYFNNFHFQSTDLLFSFYINSDSNHCTKVYFIGFTVILKSYIHITCVLCNIRQSIEINQQYKFWLLFFISV